MKNKIVVVALIAAVLTAGLILAGCDSGEKCSFNDGSCSFVLESYGKTQLGPCKDSSCNVVKRVKAYDNGDTTTGTTKCNC